ncbi:MAG: hypothetical protein U0930_06835 [Pirellulales bacterium]
MIGPARTLQAYDHRLKEFVHRSGDDCTAVNLGVPRSTIYGLKKHQPRSTVSMIVFDDSVESLQAQVVRLTQQVRKLRCIVRRLLVILKLSGFRLGSERLTDGKVKLRVLNEIARASKVFQLRTVLRMVDLSPSRYYAWLRKSECRLSDLSSCPKATPPSPGSMICGWHNLERSDRYYLVVGKLITISNCA